MKNFIKNILTIAASIVLFNSCGNIISNDAGKFDLKEVPKYDYYKDQIIRYSHKKQAGQKDGNQILNDQVNMSVYVPEYNYEKGLAICNFYKEYFKTLSNKLERRLTVEVNLYNSRNNLNVEKSKESDISYKGGMTYNYASNDYSEKILK